MILRHLVGNGYLDPRVHHAVRAQGDRSDRPRAAHRVGEGPCLLLLAGRTWRVTYIDWSRRRCFVEAADGRGRARWGGTGYGGLSCALTQGMREVFLGTDPPSGSAGGWSSDSLSSGRPEVQCRPSRTPCRRDPGHPPGRSRRCRYDARPSGPLDDVPVGTLTVRPRFGLRIRIPANGVCRGCLQVGWPSGLVHVAEGRRRAESPRSMTGPSNSLDRNFWVSGSTAWMTTPRRPRVSRTL